MIELAERPADTKPPRLPAGWYDPDSSAFEPLAGVTALADATVAGIEADRTVDASHADGVDAD